MICDTMLREINQTQKTNITPSCLYIETKIVELIESE